MTPTDEQPVWARSIEWRKEAAEPDACTPWFCFDANTKRVLATLYVCAGMWTLFFEDAGYGETPLSCKFVESEYAIAYVKGHFQSLERRDRALAQRANDKNVTY